MFQESCTQPIILILHKSIYVNFHRVMIFISLGEHSLFVNC